MTGVGISQLKRISDMYTMKINTGSSYPSDYPTITYPCFMWNNTSSKYMLCVLEIQLRTKVDSGSLYVYVDIQGHSYDTTDGDYQSDLYFKLTSNYNRVNVDLFVV